MDKETTEKGNASESLSLKPLVGSETYSVWVKMLKSLVPHGRTQRLAVLVAGMIQYAATAAYEKDPDLYNELFDYTDSDNFETGTRKLVPYVEKLFKDAEVKFHRANSRGQGYSIVESAIMEHERWDYMPWE